jgi:hypothetical protein
MGTGSHIQTRVLSLWFANAQLIFEADNHRFRVCGDDLLVAGKSPVFQDMLSFPQPASTELVELHLDQFARFRR